MGWSGLPLSKLNYLSSKIFKLGFTNPDQSTSLNKKWWSESPLITLSEEDIKYCYVFNNIIFCFIEVRLQFVVTFNQNKNFSFFPVIFDQKLQGIFWILETYLGTRILSGNLKLFQPASPEFVPLVL